MKEAKFRHELKYQCSQAEMDMLRARLRCIMRPDPHADESGSYLIRSIYLDDYADTCMQENEDGVSPREKWRIRSYNCSSGQIRLECKRKEHGMIQKQSCPLTMRQLAEILLDRPLTTDLSVQPLLRQMEVLRRTRLLRPKVIVQYRRTPFVCAEGNVRVTLDEDMASSSCFEKFFDPDLPARLIMPRGHQLLEVKFDEFLPDYIYHAIQMRDMRLETYSKYYLCRKFCLPV